MANTTKRMQRVAVGSRTMNGKAVTSVYVKLEGKGWKLGWYWIVRTASSTHVARERCGTADAAGRAALATLDPITPTCQACGATMTAGWTNMLGVVTMWECTCGASLVESARTNGLQFVPAVTR